MRLEEGFGNKDLESPEQSLIVAVLKTFFEDIRALRLKKMRAKDEEAAEKYQRIIDDLIMHAEHEWTAFLCGLISIDHDWFMDQIWGCATGHEPKNKRKSKRLSKWVVLPRIKRRDAL